MLELGENGLPKPGRPFDAWICEHILGLDVVHHAWPCGFMPDGCELEAAHFVTLDHKPVYGWYNKLHPVYLPEGGTWPPEPYDGFRGSELTCYVEPCPFVSTSSALFQVMEAMEGYWWEFVENPSELWAFITRGTGREEPVAYTALLWSNYPDREHAYAHAICAVAWKALWREG